MKFLNMFSTEVRQHSKCKNISLKILLQKYFLFWQILSGFGLPKKEGDSSKSILDPYVQVSVTGVPKDKRTFKTEVINNNG